MARHAEQSDWLDDAFDEEKDALIEDELAEARRKSRQRVIILLVVLVVIVLFCSVTCGGAMFLDMLATS